MCYFLDYNQQKKNKARAARRIFFLVYHFFGVPCAIFITFWVSQTPTNTTKGKTEEKKSAIIIIILPAENPEITQIGSIDGQAHIQLEVDRLLEVDR